MNGYAVVLVAWILQGVVIQYVVAPLAQRPRPFGVEFRTGWTGWPLPSEQVAAPRVLECPVQLEAVVEASHGVAENDDKLRGRVVTFEVRVQRVHVDLKEPQLAVSGMHDLRFEDVVVNGKAVPTPVPGPAAPALLGTELS